MNSAVTLRRPKRFTFAISGVFVVVVSACTSPKKIDPGYVAERWSTTLSAFNIDAVFPPRYIQPGDVFLIMDPEPSALEDKFRYKRRTVRLARVDVKYRLLQDAIKEIQLPSTKDAAPKANIFSDPSYAVRLRPVGFTGFNITNIRESDVGVGSPVGVFQTLFGFASSNNLVMSISIPNAEDSELTALDAFDALSSFCMIQRFGRNNVQEIYNRCNDKDPAIKLAITSIKNEDDMVKTTPIISLVTHVYYARQIDYTYGAASGYSIGARTARIKAAEVKSNPTTDAKLSETKPTQLGDGSSVASTTAGQGGSTKTTTTTTEKVQTVTTEKTVGSAAVSDSGAIDGEELALDLRKRLTEVQSQIQSIAQGGSLQVISSTSEGTVLRQTFDSPVAIGYRAISIKLDKVEEKALPKAAK